MKRIVYILLLVFLASANVKSDSLNTAIDSTNVLMEGEALIDSAAGQIVDEFEAIPLLRRDAPKRNTESDNSIFYVFIGLFMLLAFILFNFRPYVNRLNKGIYNVKLTQQFYRDEYQGLGREIVFLSIYILLIFSLVFHFSFERMGIGLEIFESAQLLTLFGLLLLFLLLRYFAIKFIAWLFQLDNELGIYQFNFFQSAAILSIILLPLLLAAVFGYEWMKLPALIIIGLCIILWLLFGYLRGISMNSHHLISNKFHFFIYLCALEIAPLVIFFTITGKLISKS